VAVACWGVVLALNSMLGSDAGLDAKLDARLLILDGSGVWGFEVCQGGA
jgi:hypothetical protein